MAKKTRTEMSGKEALYLIKKNNVNQSYLAECLGISPQALSSRFHAEKFPKGRQMEINKALGQRIFDVDMDITDNMADSSRVPVLDLRTAAGFNIIPLEDSLGNEEIKIQEYITVDGLRGCVGIVVYGDSMSPEYRSGDIVFVRQELDRENIAYGRPYMVITKTERTLKCIYKSNHDADLLRLTSINEDTNRHGDRLYPDREIPKENILFLYRVEGLFRRERM